MFSRTSSTTSYTNAALFSYLKQPGQLELLEQVTLQHHQALQSLPPSYCSSEPTPEDPVELMDLVDGVLHQVNDFLATPGITTSPNIVLSHHNISNRRFWQTLPPLTGICLPMAAIIAGVFEVAIPNTNSWVPWMAGGISGLVTPVIIAGLVKLMYSIRSNSVAFHDPIFREIVFTQPYQKLAFFYYLSHELTHWVQTSIVGAAFHDKDKAWREGHAVGTSTHVSNQHPNYDQHIRLKYAGYYLKNCYRSLCRDLQRPMHPDLQGDDPSVALIKDPHALGYGAFAVAEFRHGEGIYRDFLRGEFSFED